MAALPAVGSATSRSIEITWATSGIDSNPASPTTSTGTPRAVSARAIGPASALRRTSTAAVGGSCPASAAAAYRAAIWSASQSRSAATSRAARTARCPAGHRAAGRSGRTPTDRERASAETALASCSARGGLRQLVHNSLVGAGVPSARGKSVVNRGRLVAEAPRQP